MFSRPTIFFGVKNDGPIPTLPILYLKTFLKKVVGKEGT
jgi:hypothetical protein